MIPDLNDILAPDMQKILLFLIPAIATLSTLVMATSRGFSTANLCLLALLAAITIYFAPGIISVLS